MLKRMLDPGSDRGSPAVIVAEVEMLSKLRVAVTAVIDDALQRAAGPELGWSAPLLDVLLDLRRDLLDTLDLEQMLAGVDEREVRPATAAGPGRGGTA